MQGRTAARDLHDVIYLYEKYPEEFSRESLNAIDELYKNQSAIIDEYNPAYSEDVILSTEDLLGDYMKFINIYKQRNLTKK